MFKTKISVKHGRFFDHRVGMAYIRLFKKEIPIAYDARYTLNDTSRSIAGIALIIFAVVLSMVTNSVLPGGRHDKRR